MELNHQIKKYRTRLELSQEELAEKVYVSRQTVSNWETGKSYPDIHSLLLLSSLFEISLDQLIKGDIEIMKKEINEAEVQKHNHYGNIFSLLFIVSLIVFVPLVKFLGVFGIIVWVALYAVTFYYAWKVHKVQKENDVSTYKEIVAFSEGKTLDEIQKQREIGKRPYQNVIKVLCGAAAGAIVVGIMFFIFGGF
ncbi:MAG: helix-turn-helix domain-containing protein [Lachnospiraceae bacterium]|nr:helix-turn-helix domain-containing protein [Lachnospiraceae bacterium]